jgi:hypothetical protein
MSVNETRRSILGEILASAAGMLLASGMILLPSMDANASKGSGYSKKPPSVVAKYGVMKPTPKYGIKPPPPIVAKYGIKPPPPIVAKYGVKPPPPIVAKYGIKPPPPIVAKYGVKPPPWWNKGK